jgi:hypothetical protein
MSSMRRLAPLLALAVVLAGAWFAPLDEAAAPQIESGLKRALASFAAARALNAVISVAQGTEVALEPGGLGVTLAPGQALDPINDVVEQFATMMLSASIAFGVQLALLKFGAFWGVSLLLSAVGLSWAWVRWRGRPSPAWLVRLLVVLLLARFAVPLAAMGSEAAFQLFLAKDYAAAQAGIEQSASRLPGLDAPESGSRPPESLVERFRRWWSQGSDAGDRVERLKQAVEGTVEHIVKVIVVFLLQTLFVPLLLMWVLLRAARLIVSTADAPSPGRPSLPAAPG